MLISRLSQAWLEIKRPEVGASTLYTYRRILDDTVLPAFEGRTAESVEAFELQSMLMSALVTRSENEALKMRAVLRGVFGYAHDLDLIDRNPAARIRLPKGTGSRPGLIERVPTPRDALAISGCLDPEYLLMPVLAAFAGLRWQEVAALRSGDFDLSERVITVQRALGRIEGVKSPKTTASRRKTVWAAEVDEMIVRTVQSVENNDWLFRSKSGSLLHYSNWRRRHWVPACDRADLSWTFHQYRHTFAVESLRRGRSVQSVAAMMGHSNPRVTWEFYAGLFDDHLDEARAAW